MESDAEMAARLQMEEMRREAGLHGRGGMGGGRRLGGGGQRLGLCRPRGTQRRLAGP